MVFLLQQVPQLEGKLSVVEEGRERKVAIECVGGLEEVSELFVGGVAASELSEIAVIEEKGEVVGASEVGGEGSFCNPVFLCLEDVLRQVLETGRNIFGFFIFLDQGRFHGRWSGEEKKKDAASLGSEKRKVGLRANGQAFAFIGLDTEGFGERVEMPVEGFSVFNQGEDPDDQAVGFIAAQLGEEMHRGVEIEAKALGIADKAFYVFWDGVIVLDGWAPVEALVVISFLDEFAESGRKQEEGLLGHGSIDWGKLLGRFGAS